MIAKFGQCYFAIASSLSTTPKAFNYNNATSDLTSNESNLTLDSINILKILTNSESGAPATAETQRTAKTSAIFAQRFLARKFENE